MATTVSVVLPTYNEKGNIVELSLELIKEVKKAGYNPELVIVDDMSPDGTGKEAEKLRSRGVKVIVRTERGLGTAVLRGINESKGDYIVLMDCDFSHPPQFVPNLLRELKDADGVFASRYVKGGRMGTDPLQYHLSMFFNIVIKTLLGIQVLDSTNGFFAIRRKALAGLNMNDVFRGYGDYCFRLLYALKPKKLKLKEIPFKYMPRRYGESKTSLGKAGFSYGIEALKLRLK